MALFKPRRRGDGVPTPIADESEPTRDRGPWDISEQPELDGRLDFGALRLRVPEGYVVERPSNDTDGTVPVVVVRGEEGALRLRVFAAPRDTGMWEQLRADVVREVTERDGKAVEVDGPLGTEAHCQLPVAGHDGKKLIQPSRVVGFDGPRWTIRGTFLGQAALEPRDDGALMEAFYDLVITRGPEARRAGEVLPLTLPRGGRSGETPDPDSAD